jgi:hypothetical protein
MRPTLVLCILLAAAPGARASGLLDFLADKAQSNFTWSGTTSLGPIVGDPSNAFQLDGVQQLTLAAGGGPGAQWTGTLVAGDLFVQPDIQGKIPNPIPFLPPLATIRITGLRLSLAAPAFDVLPDGSFTAQVTATALSGTFTITPLAGTPSVTDLTGSSSSPAPQDGTLTSAAGGLGWTSPVDLTFSFSDPASGLSGSLALQGTLKADWTCPPPLVYCTAKTTSSGCVPALSVSGTPSASAASGFTVDAQQVEAQNVGLFFFGQSGPASTPFQGGTMCVKGPVSRLAPQQAGGSGPCSGVYSVDFNSWLAASKPALRAPGEVFFVQCWFRDPADPVSGTGLSDAVRFELFP